MIRLILVIIVSAILFGWAIIIIWAIIYLDIPDIIRSKKISKQRKLEFDAQINAVYEGAESWKQEYDDCLLLLKLMTRFVENNTHTLTHKPSDLEITALNKAKQFIEKYQHYGH